MEWHTVTPFSKYVALTLFVLLPFIGFYYGMEYGELAAYSNGAAGLGNYAPMPSASDDYYSNVSEWQTYQNPNVGFRIGYPTDFDVQDSSSLTPSTDWRVGAGGVNGIRTLSLTIPHLFEPHTNFSDAMLTIGRSGNDLAVSGCLKPDQSGGPDGATSTAVIGGNTFVVFYSSDAGAGNYYKTTSYRTLARGQCWAVEYTIHSTQIANYPEEYHLQVFDEGKLTDVLDRIVRTFRFL
jgi:hypothetical protein